MRSLTEYRRLLEQIGDGTVSTAFAREILDVAEAKIQQAIGEYTLARAMEVSGKSRGWFRRRLPAWEQQGLARQMDGGTWLIKDAAVPRRKELPSGGVDPSLSDEEIFQRMVG
jgi:hypothetical protein